MKFCVNRFNVNLVLALGVGLLTACHTLKVSKKKEAVSTFQVYIEARRDPDRSQTVKVGREQPISFSIEKQPFVSEKHVKEAKVISDVGGFALQVQLDRQGSWLLEQYTTANHGKHLVIFSQFSTPPEETLNEGRWLAATRISLNITNGLISFTPDVNRAEADHLALGLNHVAKHAQDDGIIQ
jgi:hypothetical protein